MYAADVWYFKEKNSDFSLRKLMKNRKEKNYNYCGARKENCVSLLLELILFFPWKSNENKQHCVVCYKNRLNDSKKSL
jgi:hypothetical protein